MQKYTHLAFAFLLFISLNTILHFPIYLSIFAFIGAMLPDLDIRPRKWHRKVCHNVWFLFLVLFLGFYLNLIDRTVAIVISTGFISHLLMDGITVTGVHPFWPLRRPHIKGPIKTGSFLEYVFMIVLLVVILSFYGIVSINI